ncbi:hypothetical protein POPTR_018G115550v4 [Populus trichocarpa]|uniref:Uncharacterized protein n=1 Tax=Populus trichocarpa TaxID=3694 RepID=A0ACC0RMS6_POPTR|nr:hypothetical protein POPTR_018G115550v4 [Populus trichocarpa]
MRPSFSSLSSAFFVCPSRVSRDSLGKGFMQVGAQKVHANNNTSLKEISTRVLGQEAILCKEGNCIGTMKKRSVSKKSSHHWLPSIHEDYCGPRHHKSRHH